MKSKKYTSFFLFLFIFMSIVPIGSIISSETLQSPKSANSIAFIHLTAGNYSSAIPSIISSGTGTKENPYLIRDFVIDCEQRNNGLIIDSVPSTIFIDIVNCTIFNCSGDGIFLSDYSNGRIYNNTIFNCNSGGICTFNVQNTTIANNTLYNNLRAIYCSSTVNSTIYNNTISHSTNYGVLMYSSSENNTIFNNTLEYNYCGIQIQSTGNNTISNNSILHSLQWAIRLYSATYNNVSNNYLFNTSYRLISLEANAHTNIIINNRLIGEGIFVTSSENCSYLQNQITNTSYGIFLYQSTNSKIKGNNISNCKEGIHGEWHTSLNVTNNQIYNCSDYGIRIMSYANNSIVINNSISLTTNASAGSAVYLGQINNGSFSYNKIMNSAGIGFVLSGTNNATISNNNITQSGLEAFHILPGCESNLFENNSVSNTTKGIYLYSVRFNRVHNNTVTNASNTGIHLYGDQYTGASEYNNVTNNTVSKNYRGIALDDSDNNEIAYNYLKNNSGVSLLVDSSSTNNWIHNNDLYFPYATFSTNGTKIVAGQYVAFDSTASTGDFPLNYIWNFNDSTGLDYSPNPIHKFPTAGIYNVSLSINDNQNDVANYTLQIIVDVDLVPIANFSMSSNLTYVGKSVTFTNTTQSGNLGLLVEWDFGDGSSNQTGSIVSHTYTSVGVFNVTLKVTDFNGNISYCVYNITVLPNTFPSLSISANSTLIFVDDSVLFIDNSYPGDGPASWQWNFGDSTSNLTLNVKTNVTHKYTRAGNFTVVCTITDSNGDTNTTSFLIQVENDYIPTADFSLSKYTYYVNESIAFTVPTQQGNFPLQYEWNFGDGSENSTLRNLTHSYSKAGNYTITLTVVDRDGDIDVYYVSISITDSKPFDLGDFDFGDLINQPWFPYVGGSLGVFLVVIGIMKSRSSSSNSTQIKKRTRKNVPSPNENVDFQF